MCCDWDPDPPCIQESYVFHSNIHIYIIAISKQDAAWPSHSGEGKLTEVLVVRADRRETVTTTTQYWKANTWWVQVFWSESHHIITAIQLWDLPGSAPRDRCSFSGRNGMTDRIIDRMKDRLTDRVTEAFPRSVVFFSTYMLPKTLPVTTELLFGMVTLLCGLKCGTFLFYLMSEGSV